MPARQDLCVAGAADGDEAVAQVKCGSALVSGHNLKLDAAPLQPLRSRDRFLQQRCADAAAAKLRRDVELFEPAYHAAVFGTQVRGQVGYAD